MYTIKVTNRKLVGALQALNPLLDREGLKLALAQRIARLALALEREVSVLSRTVNGREEPEVEDLLDEEVDVAVPVQLTLAEIEGSGLCLTPRQLATLDPFFAPEAVS